MKEEEEQREREGEEEGEGKRKNSEHCEVWKIENKKEPERRRKQVKNGQRGNKLRLGISN